MQTELSKSLTARIKSPCLIVTDAQDQQSVYELTEGKSVLAGSGESCAIRLPGEEANLLHCMFRFTDGTLWVQDWNTQGKTLFNGTPLGDATPLSDDDEVVIGTYRFSVCLSELTASSAESEPPENSPGEPADLLPSEEIDNQECEQDSSDHHAGESEPGEEQYDPFAFDQFDQFEQLESEWLSQQVIEPEQPIAQSKPDAAGVADELEMLRNEVAHLQIELAEKDAQLLQLCEATKVSGQNDADAVTNSETEKLVVRLEELLEELEGADKKVAALENQVHAAEQANQAEQEERRQLESWVNQIEQRVLNREAETAAESEQLQKSLQEERDQRIHVESQLKNALELGGKGNSRDQAAKNMIDAVRKQNVDLENRLYESMRDLESHKENSAQTIAGADAKVSREMENRVQALEAELAGERAEAARKTEQLARFQHDMEKRLNEVKQTAETDSRVDALKQHLRELHQEEKLEQQERFERSLGGRIAKLWQKLDGR